MSIHTYFENPTGMSRYPLVCGKSWLLPLELEHKALWSSKCIKRNFSPHLIIMGIIIWFGGGRAKWNNSLRYFLWKISINIHNHVCIALKADYPTSMGLNSLEASQKNPVIIVGHETQNKIEVNCSGLKIHFQIKMFYKNHI